VVRHALEVRTGRRQGDLDRIGTGADRPGEEKARGGGGPRARSRRHIGGGMLALDEGQRRSHAVGKRLTVAQRPMYRDPA
jgi:hypothetical protein